MASWEPGRENAESPTRTLNRKVVGVDGVYSLNMATSRLSSELRSWKEKRATQHNLTYLYQRSAYPHDIRSLTAIGHYNLFVIYDWQSLFLRVDPFNNARTSCSCR